MKHVPIKTAIKNGLEPQSLNQAPSPKYCYPPDVKGRPVRVPNSREAAKVITNGLWMVLKHSKDNTMFRRLQSLMRTIRFSRRWHVSRSRSLTLGNLHLLKGFKFNEKSSLNSIFKAVINFTTDLGTNSAKLSILSFNPRRDIDWPDKASFCRIKTMLIGLDLDTGQYECYCGFSGRLSRKTTAKTSYDIINEIPNGSFPLLIYCCGIDFYSVDSRNKASRILEIKYNPLEIGAVDYVKFEKLEDYINKPRKFKDLIKSKSHL
jgi:hypothetical protein